MRVRPVALGGCSASLSLRSDDRQTGRAFPPPPTTNGYAEAAINKVKVIKRRAHGLPSFESFRHRVLVACG